MAAGAGLAIHQRAVAGQFLRDLKSHLDAGDVNGAVQLCETDERALPQLALAAIENRELGESQLRQLVAELLQRNILADLESRLSWVATVIKSGPLLGLFGTVLGMMAAFGRIGSGQTVDQKQIASDIAIALICTAMGLMTAIPFTYMLANLNIRVRTLQDSLSSGMTRFLEYFKDVAARLPGEQIARPLTEKNIADCRIIGPPDGRRTVARIEYPAFRVCGGRLGALQTTGGRRPLRRHGDGGPGVHDEHLLSGDVGGGGDGRDRFADGAALRRAAREDLSVVLHDH